MLYLLHFDQPYHHARHYLGFVETPEHLAPRLDEHAHGHGAKLTRALKEAGIGFRCVATWDGDRHAERRLKRRKNGPRLCPVCEAARERRAGR